jgi:hypothetical protein
MAAVAQIATDLAVSRALDLVTGERGSNPDRLGSRD